jgi:hypothetical protein
LWTSGHPDHQVNELYALSNQLAKQSGLPSIFSRQFLLSRMNAIYSTHFALPGTKNVTTTFPVAVYVHGMYGWRQIHTSLCEKLASEGFIVFATDHDPDAMISRPLGSDQTNGYGRFDYDVPPFTEEKAIGEDPQKLERKFYAQGLARRVLDLENLVDFIKGHKAKGETHKQNGKNYSLLLCICF